MAGMTKTARDGAAVRKPTTLITATEIEDGDARLRDVSAAISLRARCAPQPIARAVRRRSNGG